MSMQTQLHEVILLLNPIIFMPVTVVIILIYNYKQYKKGAYYRITKKPYLSVKFDLGRYGEYLIYKSLRCFENNGAKFLFNTYIPKGNNETTEIDVLLICSKGLFVFESKNYSGWIFGDESQKNWTQIIYDNKKRFYNPIMQNKSHIKHLKKLIGEHIPMRPIIVFSDRCTLKDIKIKSVNISVIKRYNLKSVVMQIWNQIQDYCLTETEINDIYNKLYPYTQNSYEAEVQHIENIRKKIETDF